MKFFLFVLRLSCLAKLRVTIIRRNERVHDFPKAFIQKVNLIAGLVFELTYYDVSVKHVNHYDTMTSLVF